MRYLEALKSKRYTNCNISFSKKGERVKFESTSARDLFNKVIDWLFATGYKFEGDFHSKKNQTRCLLNTSEVLDKINRTTYAKKDFHNIPGSDYWIMCATPIKQMYHELFKMLSLHGVDDNSINTDGLDIIETGKITKASDFLKKDNFHIPSKLITKEYLKSPFKQAICVLGDPGVGKSYTIREILRKDKHIFQIIEPTATTTNLLAQFSPNKGGYVPSRLGNLLIEASKHPDKLYTAIIDEFHKSNVIDMVNDELKHAISTKRYGGDRFILSDDSNDYLKSFLDEDDGGNLIVPDNFGFIFLSSKPDIVINNGDIFDRLDIVNLRHHKEENIKSVSDLINRASQSDIEKKHLLNKK